MKYVLATIAVILFFAFFIENASAAPRREFSILSYNTALTHYERREFALTYNDLLESTQSMEAGASAKIRNIFFPSNEVIR